VAHSRSEVYAEFRRKRSFEIKYTYFSILDLRQGFFCTIHAYSSSTVENEFISGLNRQENTMSDAKKTPPLKPLALMNFRKTDEELAKIIGSFWKLTWNKENPAIDQRTKYLLSLSNAVGAHRYRQATRELVKAYAAGTTVAEFDELFSLFVWNQGAGHFASEIGPSQLFAAYQCLKTLEQNGLSREEVSVQLSENFGEKNRAVATGYAPENFKK
jgi:hypothetical protein